MLFLLGGGPTTTDHLLLLAITLVATALSLYIVFQAYRGYRRNESRRMLFLAVGLALITIAPVALWIVGVWLGNALDLGPRLYTFFMPAGSRLLEICGLGIILYSLFTHD